MDAPHRYQLTLKDRAVTAIQVNDQKVGHFLEPDNHSQLPKLYIVKSESEVVYVGQTTQNMRTRLRQGLQAQGKTGYHGYMWKDLPKVELLVWSFPDKGEQFAETLEGEIVFLFRKRTGRWPRHQMEIHFHNASAENIGFAEAILDAC